MLQIDDKVYKGEWFAMMEACDTAVAPHIISHLCGHFIIGGGIPHEMEVKRWMKAIGVEFMAKKMGNFNKFKKHSRLDGESERLDAESLRFSGSAIFLFITSCCGHLSHGPEEQEQEHDAQEPKALIQQTHPTTKQKEKEKEKEKQETFFNHKRKRTKTGTLLSISLNQSNKSKDNGLSSEG